VRLVSACSRAEEDLRSFLLQHVPAEHQCAAMETLERLEAAHHEMAIEQHVAFRDAVNHAEKFKQASGVLEDLLLKVFHAHTAKDEAEMHKLWLTRNRVLEEFSAPVPTSEEVRAEIESRLAALTVE